VLASACGKVATPPLALLTFFKENDNQPVEWLEVWGNRYRSTGNLYITAQGINDEKFQLSLPAVQSKGLIQGLTTKNIFYCDNYGFVSDTLKSVELIILHLSESKINGRYSVSFGSKLSSRVISAHGEFSIHGQE
jgi:hypothetical protein